MAGHAPQQFTQGEHGFVVVDDILEPEQVGLVGQPGVVPRRPTQNTHRAIGYQHLLTMMVEYATFTHRYTKEKRKVIDPQVLCRSLQWEDLTGT